MVVKVKNADTAIFLQKITETHALFEIAVLDVDVAMIVTFHGCTELPDSNGLGIVIDASTIFTSKGASVTVDPPTNETEDDLMPEARNTHVTELLSKFEMVKGTTVDGFPCTTTNLLETFSVIPRHGRTSITHCKCSDFEGSIFDQTVIVNMYVPAILFAGGVIKKVVSRVLPGATLPNEYPAVVPPLEIHEAGSPVSESPYVSFPPLPRFAIVKVAGLDSPAWTTKLEDASDALNLMVGNICNAQANSCLSKTLSGFTTTMV